MAFINTFGATAAAVLTWCIGEAMVKGKASMLGAASGAVAGLVAITPAAGNVGIGGALAIGLLAATMVTPADYSIAAQVWIQAKAVGVTVLWSGIVSAIAYFIVDKTIGLRVSEEDEREGLDITSHGETAYSR